MPWPASLEGQARPKRAASRPAWPSRQHADEILKQWAGVHGLGVAPALTNKVKGYPHRVWRDATGEDLVDAYAIPDMAHGVPVEPGRANAGPRPRSPSTWGSPPPTTSPNSGA